MQVKNAIFTDTVIASGAVTKNRLVTHAGAQATVAGEVTYGPAVFDAVDGDSLAIDCLGTSIVEAGGAIGRGNPVTADNQGRAVVQTTPASQHLAGHARAAAANAGDFIELFLR